jgi:carbamoyltransferase
MKLLSVALTWHDVNISYFDGSNVYYHKLERTKQIKRFWFDNIWEWKLELEKLWNINVQEIDEVVFIFDTYEKIIAWENFPEPIKSVSRGKLNFCQLENNLNPFRMYGLEKAYYIGHHYAHSLSSWMLYKGNNPKYSFVFDGAGERKSWSVYQGDILIDSGHISNGSIGWGIREAGRILGISYGHQNDIAGKFMSLQSYGNLDKNYLEFLKEFKIENLKDVFSIDHWISYKKDKLLAELSLLDWSNTIHYYVGDLLIDFFSRYANDNDVICYAGGVAQNVVWNTKLKRKFKNLIIPPHSSDEGLSLGGLEFLRKKNNISEIEFKHTFPYCQSDVAPGIDANLQTIKLAAEMLANGKVIGWYQGHGEIGPRALGNRSILMNPLLPNGKERINQIKQRENYRPFGASVLEEYADDYFCNIIVDEYMLFVSELKTHSLESISHIDKTSRIQVVTKNNYLFRTLLEEFYKLTNCAVLLNTSLNVAGKPLAGYPENAIDLLYFSEIDMIFIGNEIYSK